MMWNGIAYGYRADANRMGAMRDFVSTGSFSSRNEARMYLLLCSGTADAAAADFCTKRMGKFVKRSDCLQMLHRELIDADVDGTTSAALLLLDYDEISVQCVGNCRAVVVGSSALASVSHDAGNASEVERMREAGYAVGGNGWFTKDDEPISRASRVLGKCDDEFYPHPSSLSVDRDGSEEFIVAASSGLWMVMNPDQVADHVRNILDAVDDPEDVAESLITEAKSRGSVTNVTVVVVMFSKSHVRQNVKRRRVNDSVRELVGSNTEALSMLRHVVKYYVP